MRSISQNTSRINEIAINVDFASVQIDKWANFSVNYAFYTGRRRRSAWGEIQWELLFVIRIQSDPLLPLNLRPDLWQSIPLPSIRKRSRKFSHFPFNNIRCESDEIFALKKQIWLISQHSNLVIILVKSFDKGHCLAKLTNCGSIDTKINAIKD